MVFLQPVERTERDSLHSSIVPANLGQLPDHIAESCFFTNHHLCL